MLICKIFSTPRSHFGCFLTEVFKQVRRSLRIADNVILSQYPEMEDYLLPDVKVPNEFEWCSLIKNIKVEFAL